MAWDVASFKLAFPEFEPTEEPLVSQALADASREFDPRVCGELTDRLIGLKAAHYLAIAPFGQGSRTKKATSVTTYSLTIEDLLQTKAGGPWGLGYIP